MAALSSLSRPVLCRVRTEQPGGLDVWSAFQQNRMREKVQDGDLVVFLFLTRPHGPYARCLTKHGVGTVWVMGLEEVSLL